MKITEKFITVRRILIESLEKCGAELKKICIRSDNSLEFSFTLRSINEHLNGKVAIPNCENKSIKDILLEIIDIFQEEYDNFDEDVFVKEIVNKPNAPSIKDLLRDADKLQYFLYRITRELLRAILWKH